MFGFKDIDLKQTRFYQQAVSEGEEIGLEKGIAKGIEKGMAKGIEKGIAKGRAEGEAALLLRILERRFGPLAEGLRERVRAADAETLLRWGERILTAATPEEVVKE